MNESNTICATPMLLNPMGFSRCWMPRKVSSNARGRFEVPEMVFLKRKGGSQKGAETTRAAVPATALRLSVERKAAGSIIHTATIVAAAQCVKITGCADI